MQLFISVACCSCIIPPLHMAGSTQLVVHISYVQLYRITIYPCKVSVVGGVRRVSFWLLVHQRTCLRAPQKKKNIEQITPLPRRQRLIPSIEQNILRATTPPSPSTSRTNKIYKYADDRWRACYCSEAGLVNVFEINF